MEVGRFTVGTRPILDFGKYRITYRYFVRVREADPLVRHEQDMWCTSNFKVDRFRSARSWDKVMFVHKKDAVWFALKWG